MIPKFRAWDKFNKIFTNYKINDDIIYFYEKYLGTWKRDDERKRFELMQSTGLKDINGVEIFEGDILENTTQISYLGEKYKVVKNEKYANFILLDNKGLASNIPIFESETSYEVIGNIYENKDLLGN